MSPRDGPLLALTIETPLEAGKAANSEYRGAATLDQVLALARGAEGADPNGERAEFVRLVESARLLRLAEGRGSDAAH